MPLESPFVFYPKRIWRTVSTTTRLGWMTLKLLRLGRRVKKDPKSADYMDAALTPVVDRANESLEMFEQTEAARTAVERAQRQAQQRKSRAAL